MTVVSLKGERSVVWGGMGDASTQWPTAGGPFRILRNFVTSRDGTELRRVPGVAVTGRPDYLDIPETGHATFSAFGITSQSGSSLVLNRNHRLPAGLPVVCYVEGNTNVADGYYEATRTAAGSVTISGTHSGSSGDGVIYFRRMQWILPHLPHALKWVDSYPVVVADTEAFGEDGDIGSPFRHFAAWVGRGGLDWNSPPSRWENWFSTINQQYITNYGGPAGETHVDFPPRRKCQLETTNDNLVVAVPGVGCCFIVDVSARRTGLFDLAGVTRALGTPQGSLVSATPTAGPPGGTLTSDSTYWVAVGFRSLITGELGLISKPVQVALGPTDTQIDVVVSTPRRILLECGPYNAIVYLSEPDGPEPAGLQPVHTEAAINTFGTQSMSVLSHTPYSTRTPFFEQMPLGASFVKTIRGTTIFGGMICSIIYDDDLFSETVRVVADDLATPERNTIAIRDLAGSNFGAMNAAYLLSPAFAGVEATINNTRTRLRKKVDGATGSPPANGKPDRWEFDGQWDSASTGQERTIRIHAPKGETSISERGKPGITPAAGGDGGSGRIIIDRIRGQDVVGSARLNDAALLMTDHETYSLAWGRSPFGSDPVLLSDQYGCVSRDSIVEYPMGAAWMSQEGPVISAGGRPQWIGAPVLDYWRSLKSSGSSPHVWGFHDESRRLVIWGVRSNWFNSDAYPDSLPPGAPPLLTLSDLRSRAPCDELLIWHYDSGSFQTARFPAGKSFFNMEKCLHADLGWYTSALSGVGLDLSGGGQPLTDYNIVTFRDEFADHQVDVVESVALQSPLYLAGPEIWFVGSNNDFRSSKAGDHAFIRTGDDELEWWGEIAEVDAVNYDRVRLNLTDPSLVNWAVGAVMVTKCIHAEMVTNKMRFEDVGSKSDLECISIRGSAVKESGTPRVWAYVTVNGVRMHDERWGKKLSSIDDLVRFDRGEAVNNEHELSITVIADCCYRMKDVLLEVNEK